MELLGFGQVSLMEGRTFSRLPQLVPAPGKDAWLQRHCRREQFPFWRVVDEYIARRGPASISWRCRTRDSITALAGSTLTGPRGVDAGIQCRSSAQHQAAFLRFRQSDRDAPIVLPRLCAVPFSITSPQLMMQAPENHERIDPLLGQTPIRIPLTMTT